MALEPATLISVGKMGAAMAQALSAFGSALGIGVAGMAAIGAWKKCHVQNKSAPLLQFIIFTGAPITQTFYGMIVTNQLTMLAKDGAPFPAILLWGLLSGTAIGLSAYIQGRIGASAADAFAETGQGFTNHLIALGIIESVAIFVMIFTLIFA